MNPRRLRAPLAALLLVPLGGCVFTTCDPPGPPEPAMCATPAPSSATLTALELGVRGAGFPAVDGARAEIEVGGQGFSMIVAQVAWQSAEPLSCAPVSIRVLRPDDESELLRFEAELAATDEPPWQITSEVYLVIDGWPSTVLVEAEAYGSRVVRRIEVRDPPDAGTDAALGDASP